MNDMPRDEAKSLVYNYLVVHLHVFIPEIISDSALVDYKQLPN